MLGGRGSSKGSSKMCGSAAHRMCEITGILQDALLSQKNRYSVICAPGANESSLKALIAKLVTFQTVFLIDYERLASYIIESIN
jgi:hypothetical protein